VDAGRFWEIIETGVSRFI